jgi:hypothetical protein
MGWSKTVDGDDHPKLKAKQVEAHSHREPGARRV